MRPLTLEEFVGQEDILGLGKLLQRAIVAEIREVLLPYPSPIR